MQKLFLRFSKLSQGPLKYGAAALLISVPLFPKFPFLAIPGTQVSIRLEDFLILIVSLIWFINILPRIKDILSDDINKAIFVFLAIGLASTLTGIFLTKTVVLHIGLLHWARRVEYLAAFFIGVSAVKNKQNLKFFIKILTLVIAFAFVFGVGQKYFNWPVITTQNSEYAKGIALRYRPGGHLISTFAGHYDLATYIILVVPIFLGFLFSSKKVLSRLAISTSHHLTRAVLLSSTVVSVWLLVMSASRISIASYLGTATLALLLTRRAKLIPIVLIISLGFTLFSSNLIDRYMQIFDVALRNLVTQVAPKQVHAQRLESSQLEVKPKVQVFEDRSTSIRLNVEWPRALRAFTKNPLFGTGYSSITLATDNGYLRLLGELGILGIVSFLLVIVKIILKLLSKIPISKTPSIESIYIATILAAIPGVLLNMVFIDILEASKFAIMFWLLIGFAIGAVKYEKTNS